MSANGVSHREGKSVAGFSGLRAELGRLNPGEEPVSRPGVGEGELAELAALRRLQAAGLVAPGDVEAIEISRFSEAA